MSEFTLIDRYCKGIGPELDSTVLSVGDDAAVVSVPSGMELAVSVDSMVSGVHFYPDTAPEDLAYKLLAVNLSDMAAMGATPQWATMTLTLPEIEDEWLDAFSVSLAQTATKYSVQLIGGDTTKGPLNLSLNIMGLVRKGKALTRSSAKLGDDVYISNTVGDAGLALACIEGNVSSKKLMLDSLLPALHRPVPQVGLGQGLVGLASACIDISDGLVADFSHICVQSGVSMDLDLDSIPVSPEYTQWLAAGGHYHYALSGGDDYQLGFTAPAHARQQLNDMAAELGVTITRVGRVVETCGVPSVSELRVWSSGKRYDVAPVSGYQHFS